MSDDILKILTVCTHNRTRSVMSMAMLQAQLDQRLGPRRAVVRSLGFGPEGEPAIADAVAAMARRGLDVSAHRSLQVTGSRVDQADLILTSEKDHVVGIAAESPDAARRSFTLPEFLMLNGSDPGRVDDVRDRSHVNGPPGRSLAAWATSLSADRSPAEYLVASVPEIDDPTGSSPRRFEEATAAIETMCARAADMIAAHVGDDDW